MLAQKKILYVKFGLDEIIGFEIGYLKYFRESYKVDKLLIKLKVREAIIEQIRLEKKFIIWDGRIRV